MLKPSLTHNLNPTGINHITQSFIATLVRPSEKFPGRFTVADDPKKQRTIIHLPNLDVLKPDNSVDSVTAQK